MRVGGLWMGGLAVWMGLLSLLLWLWIDEDLAPALLTGAAVALGLIALYAAVRSEGPPGSRRLAESSLPTVVIAVGVAMAVNGFAFGLFLILIGAEVAALGIAGLVIEHLEDRRARRRSQAGGAS
jgi:hypothetical protein